eukprot:10388-Heterococcus_DN1.PRE.2
MSGQKKRAASGCSSATLAAALPPVSAANKLVLMRLSCGLCGSDGGCAAVAPLSVPLFTGDIEGLRRMNPAPPSAYCSKPCISSASRSSAC